MNKENGNKSIDAEKELLGLQRELLKMVIPVIEKELKFMYPNDPNIPNFQSKNIFDNEESMKSLKYDDK
jgi:hypothetical protein